MRWTALAAIGVARFDSLSIPEQTAPSPEPSPVGDVELKSLFPADLLGPSDQPLNVETTIGPEALRAYFRGNAKATRSFEQLVAALAPQGRTIDDVSIGSATLSDIFTGLFALRVRGADASALLPRTVPLLVAHFLNGSLLKFGKPRQAPAHVGGKDVTMLTPAKKSRDAGQAYAYIYAHDDVVWLVVGFGDGKDAVSKEALQKLP